MTSPTALHISPSEERAPGPLRVLLIDASADGPASLEHELGRSPRFDVVGVAPDPYTARNLLFELDPEAVVLDLIMEDVDSAVFCGRLMRHFPIPVLALTAPTAAGGRLALDALRAGAADSIARDPETPIDDETAARISDALSGFSHFDPHKTFAQARSSAAPVLTSAGSYPKESIVVVGCTTGGPEVLRSVLMQLPANGPPMLVAMPAPEHVVHAFCDEMDARCAVEVCTAAEGDPISMGCVYIAPGDRHMMMRKTDTGSFIRLKDGPLVGRHRPSLNVLFKSVARAAGENAIGVLLSGAGADGVDGMRAVREAGGATVVQNADSARVFDLPRQAVEQGVVQRVVHLENVAAMILDLARP